MTTTSGRHVAAPPYPSARRIIRRVGWDLDTFAAETLCRLGERAMERRYAREAGSR